ncbi:hypothetical protein LCGC14_0598710 [marine sediment metagenome]|uniref:Uncharacterized protein n=1 Tax=marine sediment metagenome TaxID=412755 RepID=A0A0F9UJN0_9ZZZZ
MDRKTLTYEGYLASDVWKCPKASINPDILLQVENNTGAHHWIEVQNIDEGIIHTGLYYCEYCYDTGKRPVYWEQARPKMVSMGFAE